VPTVKSFSAWGSVCIDSFVCGRAARFRIWPDSAEFGVGGYPGYTGRDANIAAEAAHGRVEMWRGGFRLNISVCRPFRLAVP